MVKTLLSKHADTYTRTNTHVIHPQLRFGSEYETMLAASSTIP